MTWKNVLDFSDEKREEKRERETARKNLAAYKLRTDPVFIGAVDDVIRCEDPLQARTLLEMLATYVFDRAWEEK